MLQFFFFFVYIVLNVYVIIRTMQWFSKCHPFFRLWTFRIIYVAIMGGAGSLVIMAFYLQESGEHFALERFSSQLFGVWFYLFVYVTFVDVGRKIVRISKRIPERIWNKRAFVLGSGCIVILLVIITSVYGFRHAREIQMTSYNIQVDKTCGDTKSLRIGVVADQHLGYNMGIRDMEKMATLLNAQDLDIVCFAGDIFDNNYNALDDPEGIKAAFKTIKSRYGVYACWGNHDVKEPLFSGFSVQPGSFALRDPRMKQLLIDAGIQVLEDEVVEVSDSFYMIGRLDYQKAGDGTSNRKGLKELLHNVDQSKPIIVMDHQPRGLTESARAGVDLNLGGHTHGGQIFPLTLANEWIWDNGGGLVKRDNMYSIVTSGVGVYGSAMRVCSDSEVVIVNVDFT